jgi:hypothetical protein
METDTEAKKEEKTETNTEATEVEAEFGDILGPGDIPESVKEG